MGKRTFKAFIVNDAMSTLKELYKSGQANTGYAIFLELMILDMA